jgi:hypothetical protein
MRISKILFILFVGLTSCEDTECQPGSQGCQCIIEQFETLHTGFCEIGLECFQGKCIQPLQHNTIDQQFETDATVRMDIQ